MGIERRQYGWVLTTLLLMGVAVGDSLSGRFSPVRPRDVTSETLADPARAGAEAGVVPPSAAPGTDHRASEDQEAGDDDPNPDREVVNAPSLVRAAEQTRRVTTEDLRQLQAALARLTPGPRLDFRPLWPSAEVHAERCQRPPLLLSARPDWSQAPPTRHSSTV